MGKERKEACKKEACDIQACLTKSNFIPQRCLNVIERLQSCCEKCKYNSTHCASLSGLLKTNSKKPTAKDSEALDSTARESQIKEHVASTKALVSQH